MAGDNIGFTIHIFDLNSNNNKDPWALDRFGINISYFPEGGAYLPNSDPINLQGGNIDMKDLPHTGK